MKTCIDGNVNHNTNNAQSSTVTAVLTRTTTTTTTISKTSAPETIIPKTLTISTIENKRTSNQHHHLEESNDRVNNLQTLTSTNVPVNSNVLRYRCSSNSASVKHETGRGSCSDITRRYTNDANMGSNVECLVMTCSYATTTMPTSIPIATTTPTSKPHLVSASSSLHHQSSLQSSSSFKLYKANSKIVPGKTTAITAATITNTPLTTDNIENVEKFNKKSSSLAQCDSNFSPTTSSVINTSISMHNGHAFKQDVHNNKMIDAGKYQREEERNNINSISIRENSSLTLSLLSTNVNKTPPITEKTLITETTPETISYVNSPGSPISAHSWYSTSSTSTASIGAYLNTGVENTSSLSINSNASSSVTTTTPTTSSSATFSTRTTPASLSPTTPSTKATSISGLLEYELLQWQDMPKYLQFNPYVLKGYRPLQTFNGCLLSLFYWHNETINILTHAIPIVYILAIVPGLMPWDSGYRFLSFCHVFGSVAPWCGSFVYHLFMNIQRGENAYYTLLKLDMVGIWVTQSFGALPLVTATTYCFSQKWKWFIIASYCAMSLWGLYKALTASSPWQRRLCFALPFTMRSILTFLRTLGTVGGNYVALPHVYLQDAVSLVGGAIGAMRIPEKWFPGLVDFYLNSHNIMHVLVVVAVYSMHKKLNVKEAFQEIKIQSVNLGMTFHAKRINKLKKDATIKDFEWMSSTTCNEDGIGGANITTDNINIEL